MQQYYVTFRISDATVANRTYDDRYVDLINTLHAAQAGFWSETTSFVIVESELDIKSFSQRSAKVLSKEDILLVFDNSGNSACYFGAVEQSDVLESFFPNTLKI